MTRYEGGCQCGAVRYVAEGEPVNQLICHCRICQRVIGAAFNARMLMRQADVTLTGPVSRYPSSDALVRGFCGQCGGTVFSARDSRGVIGLTTGSLDDPGQFRPSGHIWVSSRQPWVRLEDGLPAYEEAIPA